MIGRAKCAIDKMSRHGTTRTPAPREELFSAWSAITFTPAALPGDFNNDGKADTADYVVWRKQGLSAEKYQEWQANYGASSGSGSSFVLNQSPVVLEPATVAIFAVAATILSLQHRQRARRAR